MNLTYEKFTLPLLNWFHEHGRKHLPWQQPRTAYRVWISEIMLQQTQVSTVIPYFLRFMVRFPTIQALALASSDEVLAHWAGLGYYRRAHHLHQTAQRLYHEHNSEFPACIETLKQFPGIGPSTAAAIASLAFEQPHAILDGNVKRVLSRYFRVDGCTTRAYEQTLWQHAQRCMPPTQCAAYTQAIMDLGALCCTSHAPQCTQCPLSASCMAYQEGVVDAYPNKKPKKNVPIHAQHFLLLHDQTGHIYLEQQPPKGIWGGLWCVPRIDIHQCPITYVNETLKLRVTASEPLLTFQHALTHVRFHVHAHSLNIHREEHSTLPGCWVRSSEANRLGLPKPVSKMLGYFLNHQG